MTLHDISIVTCSNKDERFNAFFQNVIGTFGDQLQIIRVNDAQSMAEGYNRGVRSAIGKIIIFCHDDIEFLDSNTLEFIKEDLDFFDIVGVAGTSRLMEGRWHISGKKYIHGYVAHPLNERSTDYQICVYGNSSKFHIVKNIQALDGLFFAVKNSVCSDVRFDESFNGFHLYDLDFTYAAYLKGYRIAIDHRIPILHHSGGRYDAIWKIFYDKFNTKYSNVLYPKLEVFSPAIHKFNVNSKPILNQIMKNLNKGKSKKN
jgi:GT2 family glycosyltransferase